MSAQQRVLDARKNFKCIASLPHDRTSFILIPYYYVKQANEFKRKVINQYQEFGFMDQMPDNVIAPLALQNK